MATQRLQDARQVILDGLGNGSVRIGPDRPNTKWTIERISVSVNNTTFEAQARVYRGTASPSSLISGTISGSTGDTDPDLSEELHTGEFLTVTWTGGTPGGATATAVYFGKLETGYNGF